MKGYVSNIITVVLIVIAVFVVPPMFTSIHDWASSEMQMSAETRLFVDKVIDTRQITDDMLADYNLALASLPVYYSAEIQRKVRVINPDPDNPGQTYTVYMLVDDIETFEQGDIVIVTVKPVGKSFWQILASLFVNSYTQDSGFTYPGRVR